MKESNSNEEPIRSHEYDGIQEYDNNLPNWWLFTLYATIAFSIGYWIYYQKTGTGADQIKEYELALADLEAKLKPAVVVSDGSEIPVVPELDDAALWAMAKKDKDVEAGRGVYASMCASCHGLALEGAIGVSLIDDEWKHGADPLAIRGTIVNGVLEKGMPPWLPVIGEKKVNQVTAFILSHHQE